MAEYIERDHVLQLLGVFNDRVHGDYHFMNGIETAKEIVEDAPSVDVQPVKHGRWETEEVNVGSHTGGIATINIFRCSCCNEENNYEWDYCPNCGADMRGAE